MGFAEKPLQMEGAGGESEVKKWVIAGIPLRSPLKPIFTKSPHQKEIQEFEEEEEEEEENSWSTPTSEESRIPCRLTCPPPPRKKPKPSSSSSSSSRSSISSSCEYYMSNNSSSGVIREFFTPPHDFENLFARRALGRAAH